MKTETMEEIEFTYEQLPERHPLEELLVMIGDRRSQEPTLIIE